MAPGKILGNERLQAPQLTVIWEQTDGSEVNIKNYVTLIKRFLRIY
jgi:hypothetical protein